MNTRFGFSMSKAKISNSLTVNGDYLASHSNKTLLQAEIQIAFPDFCQWLICLRRDEILPLKECCAWDISRNIASLIVSNKLSQFLLLSGRKQGKQLFTDLPAGIF